jgi:hypothetical protein
MKHTSNHIELLFIAVWVTDKQTDRLIDLQSPRPGDERLQQGIHGQKEFLWMMGTLLESISYLLLTIAFDNHQ